MISYPSLIKSISPFELKAQYPRGSPQQKSSEYGVNFLVHGTCGKVQVFICYERHGVDHTLASKMQCPIWWYSEAITIDLFIPTQKWMLIFVYCNSVPSDNITALICLAAARTRMQTFIVISATELGLQQSCYQFDSPDSLRLPAAHQCQVSDMKIIFLGEYFSHVFHFFYEKLYFTMRVGQNPECIGFTVR